MKKSIAILLFLLCNLELSAITSSLNYRTTSSSPLLFALKDYSKKQSGFEVAPLYASMYDADHTNKALILNEKNTLIFDQLGNGDFNPFWINLISNEQSADYLSQVTFAPEQSQAGMLFHGYVEFPKVYVDLKTALLEMTSQVTIDEQGGNNGAEEGIKNVQQAFTNPAWNYGKIGESHQVIGLDNIQLEIGTTCSTQNATLALFGLVEAPTGAGSQAEWLFEPKVGTNHWGLGFGTESLTHLTRRTDLFFGGNYRYFFPAWEKRSFDLTANGQWSRYLGLQDTYGLVNGNFIGAAPDVDPLPGINYLTQSAYIEGRNQVNLYLSLETTFKKALFKIGYNYFYSQAETINDISNIVPGYGIYYISDPSGGGGGITTSSTATINETSTTPDPLPTLSNPLASPVAITSEMFNKKSGACQEIYSNRLSTSIQGFCGACTYGLGANIDFAMTSSALNTWAVWASFEYTFGKESHDNQDEQEKHDIDNMSINETPYTPAPVKNENNEKTEDLVQTHAHENENFLQLMHRNNEVHNNEELLPQVSTNPTVAFIMAATVPFPDNDHSQEELQTPSIDEIPELVMDLSSNTPQEIESTSTIINNSEVTQETNIMQEEDDDNKEDLSIEIPYKKIPAQPITPQKTIGVSQEAIITKKDNGLILGKKTTKSQSVSMQLADNLINITTEKSLVHHDAHDNSTQEHGYCIHHEMAVPMTDEEIAMFEKCSTTKNCGCKTICLDDQELLNKKHTGLHLQKNRTGMKPNNGSLVTSQEVIQFQSYGQTKNLTNDEILQVLNETI